MNKRNLFAELQEGFESLAQERSGKKTLRTHKVESQATLNISAEELVALRERLNLPDLFSPAIYEPTRGLWKIGNKDVPNRMRKQRCSSVW